MNDFRDFLIGNDPMQVEHHWQSMYVHSFYRAGPVIGSAISGIDQALWDIRGKVLGLPVYQLLGGPFDCARRSRLLSRRRATTRGTARRTAPERRRKSAFPASSRASRAITNGSKRTPKSSAQSSRMQFLREGLGPDIDIAIDFHAKTSPSVASILVKEVEPLNLLWIEEPCPPENVKAMHKIARRSKTPIATGERLIASYGCRELIEMGVVDILQTDINHVGGITGLWKVGAARQAFQTSPWRRMPAKVRSADSRRCTSMRPCPIS